MFTFYGVNSSKNLTGHICDNLFGCWIEKMWIGGHLQGTDDPIANLDQSSEFLFSF